MRFMKAQSLTFWFTHIAFCMAHWVAKTFPWYVRFVTGPCSDEVFREIQEYFSARERNK